MANPEHLAILKKGAEAWNRWRAQNPEIKPDLNHTNLTKANLSKANLSYAYLMNTDLS